MSTSPESKSYQADCFTPKRGLRRSPLSHLSTAQKTTTSPLHTLSGSGTVTCTPSESASFQSYQADCFTPKKGLCRSFSPAAQHCTDSENDPLHTLSDNETVTCTPSKSEPVTAFNVGRGVLREVQDVCFTPKRSLQRSPPATSEQKSSTNACDRDIKMAPPPTKWEIPRTPIETQALSTSVQFQVQPCPNINKSTPRRMKTPTHPLSQSARAESSLGKVKEAVTTSTASPPVTATLSPGVSKLPGLQYTDNDLAYLEHIKKIKELTELKANAGELNKTQHNVSEEKEHESSKKIHDYRTLELKQNIEKTTLEAKLTTTQTKWQAISTEYQIAQDELKLLQAELAKVSVNERGGDSTEEFEQN